MKTSNIFLKSALVLAMAVPMLAMADSQLTVGTGSAAANLNFRVVIPRVLLLQVGNATTVDLVEFNLTAPAIEPGLGGAGVARTNGTIVPVRVLGNNGPISIASLGTLGGLANGADTIPWSGITAVSSDLTGFPSPTTAGSTVNLTTNLGTKVTNRTANWTFNYSNTTAVAAGTYNGSVVYTASML
jgi:hypothetical protein